MQLLGETFGYDTDCRQDACEFFIQLGIVQIRVSVIWFCLHFLTSVSEKALLPLYRLQTGEGQLRTDGGWLFEKLLQIFIVSQDFKDATFVNSNAA